jgi:hypothetical protein
MELDAPELFTISAPARTGLFVEQQLLPPNRIGGRLLFTTKSVLARVTNVG